MPYSGLNKVLLAGEVRADPIDERATDGTADAHFLLEFVDSDKGTTKSIGAVAYRQRAAGGEHRREHPPAAGPALAAAGCVPGALPGDQER